MTGCAGGPQSSAKWDASGAFSLAVGRNSCLRGAQAGCRFGTSVAASWAGPPSPPTCRNPSQVSGFPCRTPSALRLTTLPPVRTHSLLAGLLLLGACSSSDDSTDTQDPPGDTAAFELQSVSNGFGQQLPHQGTFDDGVSGPVQVELRSLDQMAELMTSGVLTLDPPVAFPGAPVLPDSRPGNHFFLAQFTGDVDPETPCESICTGVGTCDVDSLDVVTFDPVTHE